MVVTAEEKGLLGSKYFAAHPTVPPKSMIADINLDMFLPIVPLKVLKVPGLAESDLGDRARDAAQLLAFAFSLTRSRCATSSFAAISTISSATEYPP